MDPKCHRQCPYGFPGGSDSKESVCNVGDLGLIPGLGRSPGGGHGNPLHYSCLETPMDRGAWRAMDCTWGHKESEAAERLSTAQHRVLMSKRQREIMTEEEM